MFFNKCHEKKKNFKLKYGKKGASDKCFICNSQQQIRHTSNSLRFIVPE